MAKSAPASPPGSPTAAAAGKKGEKTPTSPPGSPPAGAKKGSVAATPGSPPAGSKKGSLASPPGSPTDKKGSITAGADCAQNVPERISLSREPTPFLPPPVLPIPFGISDMLHPEDAGFRERAATSTTAEVGSAFNTLSFMAAGALTEIHRVFNRCEMSKNDPSKRLVREIMLARVKNIVLHGVGREGLMMRGFTMRLYHLGLKANCLGDMTCPKLGPGDLFIASAGPGEFSSVNALMITAKDAGAKVLLITAQPEGNAAKIADEVAWLPAQTMKDEDPEAGQLPKDRPSDRHSILGKPMDQLHSFHRSYKPVDIFDEPLAADTSGMLDKKHKEDAKKAKVAKLEEDIKKGQEQKDYLKANEEKKEEKEKKKKKKGGEVDESGDPKSPKSPKKGKDGKEPKGELGVGGIPGKEKIPPHMIPIEGGHIGREIITEGDPEYICLLAENKILPMGSLYEGSLYVLFEIVTFILRVKLNETVAGMVERHTNME